MAYTLNSLIEDVSEPPIAEAWRWIKGREFPEEKPLIDLAQAEPSYAPAPALTSYLAEEIEKSESARYTEIRGLRPLREALAAHLSGFYDADVSAAAVSITAGCNQAFCLAVMALAKAGDEVILPAPYYFNHQMWLEMLGVKVVPLPFRPDRGGVPDVAEAASRINGRTRAIALVTPNNPTGAVYSPAVIAEFFKLAQEHDIALIVDETYKDFLSADGPSHKLPAESGWVNTAVLLHSFSKSYALTGYRVGAIVAGPGLTKAVTKAMDCVAICAPAIGQKAALYGLKHLADWRDEKRRLVLERLDALREAFGRNDLTYELVSAGAFFAYLRHPFDDTPAIDVAKRLAEDENMLCLPGSFFGPEQEPYLRLAFANVPAGRMTEIAERLVASQD